MVHQHQQPNSSCRKPGRSEKRHQIEQYSRQCDGDIRVGCRLIKLDRQQPTDDYVPAKVEKDAPRQKRLRESRRRFWSADLRQEYLTRKERAREPKINLALANGVRAIGR